MRQGSATHSLGGKCVLVSQIGGGFSAADMLPCRPERTSADGTAPGQELAETVVFEPKKMGFAQMLQGMYRIQP